MEFLLPLRHFSSGDISVPSTFQSSGSVGGSVVPMRIRRSAETPRPPAGFFFARQNASAEAWKALLQTIFPESGSGSAPSAFPAVLFNLFLIASDADRVCVCVRVVPHTPGALLLAGAF